MARPANVCLQCGKSREQVRDPYDSPCATATYGEIIEGLDDWARHHWRDWSDAELRRAGILPVHFADHRRDDYYDLAYAPCEHQISGHLVNTRDTSDDKWDMGVEVGECVACGAKNLLPKVEEKVGSTHG